MYFAARQKYVLVRLIDHVRNELLLVGFVSLFLATLRVRAKLVCVCVCVCRVRMSYTTDLPVALGLNAGAPLHDRLPSGFWAYCCCLIISL